MYAVHDWAAVHRLHRVEGYRSRRSRRGLGCRGRLRRCGVRWWVGLLPADHRRVLLAAEGTRLSHLQATGYWVVGSHLQAAEVQMGRTSTRPSVASGTRAAIATARSCCRVMYLDGTGEGQWDYGKMRCAGSG
jgi:hypothetical protein